MRTYAHNLEALLLLVTFTLLLAACNGGGPTPAPILASPTQPSPTETPTPVIPSPTPLPLAARVNGEGITLEEFQAELARYRSAYDQAGEHSDAESENRVLDDLIDQVLLAQAAQEAGFVLDEATLQAHLARLAEQAGGEHELATWIEKHGYTAASFQNALRRSIAAAWMRDRILEAVPQAGEQVHARQILLDSAANADAVLRQIRTGVDFATLAAEYDPLSQGDLGWFPRGYLLEEAVEQAAFDLQPEEISAVIETRLGFHIIQVIERDELRPLDSDARLIWQTRALADWLAGRRAESQIEISPD